MSENGRFCVQFSGTEIHSVTKTRILYKESKPNDVREIWTQIYNTKPPNEIQLIIASKLMQILVQVGLKFSIFSALSPNRMT